MSIVSSGGLIGAFLPTIREENYEKHYKTIYYAKSLGVIDGIKRYL